MGKPSKRKAETEYLSPARDPKSRTRRDVEAHGTYAKPATHQDYDDDPGRIESQQILIMSKRRAQQSENKNDDWLQKLSSRIDDDRKELMDLLAEKEREVTKNEEAFTSHVHDLLVTARQDVSTNSGAVHQKPDHLSHVYLAATSDSLFSCCTDFLAYYKSTSEAISALQTPIKAGTEIQQGWQQDREKVENLLNLGKRVMGRRIEELVRNKRVEDLVEETVEVKSVFRGTKDWGEQGPGEVLQGIEKGVERMVKALPESDIRD